MGGLVLGPEFYVQAAQPKIKYQVDWGWVRRTSWKDIITRNGLQAKFISWWFFGHVQLYHGTAKCNGTLSYESLAKGGGYVMTDLASELLAIRIRKNGPDRTNNWNNMGMV